MRKLWNTLKVGVDNADIYYIMGCGKRIPCINPLHIRMGGVGRVGEIGTEGGRACLG